MPQATDSQIAMWRGAIALAHANGAMDEGEKNELLEYFKDNVYLSDAQRAQLISDIDKKIELSDIWSSITNPEDRGHLIDIALSLFSEHGTPTPEESAIYKKMMADQLATVDEKKYRQDIEKIKAHIPEEMAELREEEKKDYYEAGWVGRMTYHIDKFFGDLSVE